MKLLQINTVANWGSTGRIAEEIGIAAIEQGWESYIAYGRGNPTSNSNLIRIGSDFDMKLHGIQTRLFDNHGLCSRKVTRDFINQIDVINPDIVHLHNIHGYYINYQLLFKYLKSKNVPVVWTLHDCWALTGHCAYFTFVDCDKWKYGCSDCMQSRAYPSSIFIDRSKKNWEDKKTAFNSLKKLTVVPVSDWLVNIVKESFLKDANINRIYNGVNLETFKPYKVMNLKHKLAIDDKIVLLGVASVWDERKGLKDFIKLRELLSDNKIIVLIGLNEEQIKKLPKGIIGIKRTNNVQELSAYYSEADIFINPTWEDNFPTTNLEALACGTPVITYRTGGSIEAIDENTGLIVTPGDIKGLSNAINSILSNKNLLYTELLCRNRAIKEYNKNDRYRDYLDLYNILLSK